MSFSHRSLEFLGIFIVPEFSYTHSYDNKRGKYSPLFKNKFKELKNENQKNNAGGSGIYLHGRM